MRTVTVNYRDYRGRVEYNIYETAEQLKSDKPNAKIARSLADAEPGDYVAADNGWIVPLLAVKWIEDKTLRYGDRKPRKKAYQYKVFHFPKYKKAVRVESLSSSSFNYVPSTMDNFASEGKRCRMFEMSAKKILFARHLAAGTDPMTAVHFVYPKVMNKNKLLKNLLANDKLMNSVKIIGGKSMREQLEEMGLGSQVFARRLKDILDDPKSDSRLKLFAFKTIFTLISSWKDEKEAELNEKAEIQAIDMDAIRKKICHQN